MDTISEELVSTKDRIRHLIGAANWGKEGEHKEAVLRKTLRALLPENLRIGTGFILNENEISTQIDILITDKGRPTLFKDGDFTIVTPDAVKGIIEVKTKVRGPKKLKEELEKISQNVKLFWAGRKEERSREIGFLTEQAKRIRPYILSGLFIYESMSTKPEKMRECLEKVKDEFKHPNVVDLLMVGPDILFIYGQSFPRIPGMPPLIGWAKWEEKNLAYARFISTFAYNLSDPITIPTEWAWFPLEKDSGEKEGSTAMPEDGQ